MELLLHSKPYKVKMPEASGGSMQTFEGIVDKFIHKYVARDVKTMSERTQKVKVSPSLFSFNSKGACENCQGLGVVYVDLSYMGEVKVPCEVCGGKRFKDEVLAYRFHGKSISDRPEHARRGSPGVL